MNPRIVGGHGRLALCLNAGLLLAAPALAVPGSVFEEPPAGRETGEASVAGSASAGVVVLAQISGVVASEDGNPLPGALVSVFAADSDDGAARFAVTDEEGRFEVGEASP
ncbi:MAG: carboxypeptidase-like regulatory domain-containing protein, partial [Acidobacteriota bacterium]|nr:carboxypeptidase-like regulatory domain-containing protein [Acidobacteriota bacterium]